MGTKCSCLFNKDRDSTYHLPNDENGKVPSIRNTEDFIKKKFTQILTVKGNETTMEPASYNFNMDNSAMEDEIFEIDDTKIIHKLIKLQAIVRRFLKIKQFKRNKLILINDTKKILDYYKASYRTQSLYRVETEKYEPYNRNGWTKYYPTDTKKFDLNYGKVFETEILVYEDEAYYTGQVNINYQKHGFGKMTYKDGTQFEGFWQLDKFTGWGRYIDQEGTLFEGMFT